MRKLIKAALSLEHQEPDHIEREVVYYGELASFDVLKSAAKAEAQEQWQIRIKHDKENSAAGTIRVRSYNDSVYEMTTKVNRPDIRAQEEYTLPATKEMFEAFKKLAPAGLMKTRYYFPIPGTEGTWTGEAAKEFNGALCWEFDVFKDSSGEFGKWVKIDLELPNRETPIPKLPEWFTRLITTQTHERVGEEAEMVDYLYEHKFITLNPNSQSASNE